MNLINSQRQGLETTFRFHTTRPPTLGDSLSRDSPAGLARLVIGAALSTFLLLTSCAAIPTAIGVPPAPTPSATPRYGEAFSLRGGQEVRFVASPPTMPAAELLVRFVEVVSDERCPARVTCAWANPPVIVLEAAFAGRPPRRYTIKGSYNINRVQFDGLALEFIDLNPYPQQPDEFSKVKPLSTYIVTLRATGARVE